MAHDIFISYVTDAPHSRQAALGIVHELEERGIRCWIAPRDMASGKDYMAQLADRVPESKALVLVFSSEANGSPHVKREVALAFEKEVPILPFRVEDVEPARELDYCIGHIHWLDALDPPLSRHIERLADRLEQILAEGPSEQVALLRRKKAREPQWRAVVWAVKHGALATATVAVAGLLLLGGLVWGGYRVMGWLPSDRIAGAEEYTGTVDLGGVSREATPSPTDERVSSEGESGPDGDDLTGVVVKSLVCDNGSCAVNGLPGLVRVRRILFGEEPDRLDREVDVQKAIGAAAGRRAPIRRFPIDPAAEGIFVQVEDTEGRLSEVEEVPIDGHYAPHGSVRRLDLVTAPEGVSDPGVYLGLGSLGGDLTLITGSPWGATAILYAFDEGGMFEQEGPEQVRTLEMPEDAETVRLSFRLDDGELVGPLRYRLPSIEGARTAAARAELRETVSEAIRCVRVTGELPSAPDSGTIQSTEDYFARRDAIQLAHVQLVSARLTFLDMDEIPVLACLPETRDWRGAQEVHLRTEEGAETSAQITQAGPGSRFDEFWTARLSAETRAIYATVLFDDGSRSDEVRIPIEELDLDPGR